MHEHAFPNLGRHLRARSRFSGYGGLDLAVEHVFNAGASAKAVKLGVSVVCHGGSPVRMQISSRAFRQVRSMAGPRAWYFEIARFTIRGHTRRRRCGKGSACT